MATIYNHITGNGTGSNCLILDSKERLIYPFNVGDYSEIRWGMIFSYAPATTDNGPIATELINGSSFGSTAYFGVCNYNTGVWKFPGGSNGYDFIGLGGGTALVGLENVGGLIRYNMGGSFNTPPFLLTTQTGRLRLDTSATNYQNWMAITPSTGVYGETKFSSMAGQRIVLEGNQYNFRGFYNNNSSNDVSDYYLQTGLSVMPNTQTIFTGFWTSGHTASSPVMLKPNAIYIYNPMPQRLRIHNIMVERYA